VCELIFFQLIETMVKMNFQEDDVMRDGRLVDMI